MSGRVILDDLWGDDFANEFLSLVSEVCGESSVHALIAAHGGTAAYVPRYPAPKHILCQTLGLDDVRKIADAFGSGWVEIPLGETSFVARSRAAVSDLTAEGQSARKIARRLGISQRTVFRHRRKLKAQQ